MFGMFGEENDCTTLVEDYRLDNAGDYMTLVSSGMTVDSAPPIVPKPTDHGDPEFELFYGVQNDPNYKKFKEGLSGFGGLGCNCQNKPNMNGLSGSLGPNYGAWPPGPRPDPYKWTAPNGITWTLILLDGKWVYQSSRDKRMFITTSTT